MSIFKETFQPHIFRQLKIREAIMNSHFGFKAPYMPVGSALPSDKNFGRLGQSALEILKPGDALNELETIETDPGAFYTLNVEKQCVIKMSSGVDLRDDCSFEGTDIVNPIYEGAPYEDPDDMNPSTLAERYVLYGGVNTQGAMGFPAHRKHVIEQHEEMGLPTEFVGEDATIRRRPRGEKIGYVDSAYGDPSLRSDAKDGYGIVPMPGIKEMTIRTTSAYGSLRVAKVNFHCHNRRQLEILELLYMRPGYPILIEWGWTPYINNEGKRIDEFLCLDERGKNGFFNSEDPLTIKEINELIFNHRKLSGGNYDGFLGFCKNFEFKVREDGGYDCVTEIIAAGEVLESLKGKRGDAKGRLRYATTWEEFLTKSTGYDRFMDTWDPESVKVVLTDRQYKAYGIEKPANTDSPLYGIVGLMGTWSAGNDKSLSLPEINLAIYDAGHNLNQIFEKEDYRAAALKAGWIKPVDNLELYLTAMADTYRKKLVYSKSGTLGLMGSGQGAGPRPDHGYGNHSEAQLKVVKGDSWLNDKDYIDLYLIAKKLTSGWAPKGDKFTKENRGEILAFLRQGLMHDMSYYDEDVHDYVGDDGISGSPNGEAHGEMYYATKKSAESIVLHGNYSTTGDTIRMIKEPTRDAQGTAYQKIPASFVRWDFLCEIINNLCIPKYRSKSTTSHIDDKWNGKDELGITEISYTRDNIGGRNKEEYISYSRFFIPDTNLSQLNMDFKTVGKQIDKSIDPGVCLFPNQADIGRMNMNKGVPAFKFKGGNHYQSDHHDIANGMFPLKGKNKKNKLHSIGYIYLNIKHLRDVYKEMRYTGEETLADDFSLLKYLKRIWEDVSTATGNTHNFIVQTEYENPNVVRVIDTSFDGEGLTKNLYEFDIMGRNSIVRDFNYHSTIPSALSSTIAIAAQAGGDIDDLDKVSFAAFNENVRSRFTDIVENSENALDIYNEQRRTLAENILSLKSYFNQIELGEGWYDINLNNEQPLIHTDSAHRMMNQIIKTVTIINAKDPKTGKLLPGNNINMPKSAIIPIKFSAKMDGIGGFVIGNVFKVKKDKLPKAYQSQKIAFVVLNESQKVTSGQDWTTTIGGSIILQDENLKREDDGKIPNYTPAKELEEDPLEEEFGLLECPIADYVREYFYWLQSRKLTDPIRDNFLDIERKKLGNKTIPGSDGISATQAAGWAMQNTAAGRHLSLANGIDGKIDETNFAIQERIKSGVNGNFDKFGPYAGRLTTTGRKKWAYDKGRSKSTGPWFTRDMTPRLAEVMLAMMTMICKEVFGYWEQTGDDSSRIELHQRGRRISAINIQITSVGRAHSAKSQHTKGKAMDFVFRNKSKGSPHEMSDKDMYVKLVEVIRGFTGANDDVWLCNEYEDSSFLDDDIRGRHRDSFDHFHLALDGGCSSQGAGYGEDKKEAQDDVKNGTIQGYEVKEGYIGLGGSSELNMFKLNDLLYKDTDYYNSKYLPDNKTLQIGTGTFTSWPTDSEGTPMYVYTGFYQPYQPQANMGTSPHSPSAGNWGPLWDESTTQDPSTGITQTEDYSPD